MIKTESYFSVPLCHGIGISLDRSPQPTPHHNLVVELMFFSLFSFISIHFQVFPNSNIHSSRVHGFPRRRKIFNFSSRRSLCFINTTRLGIFTIFGGIVSKYCLKGKKTRWKLNEVWIFSLKCYFHLNAIVFMEKSLWFDIWQYGGYLEPWQFGRLNHSAAVIHTLWYTAIGKPEIWKRNPLPILRIHLTPLALPIGPYCSGQHFIRGTLNLRSLWPIPLRWCNSISWRRPGEPLLCGFWIKNDSLTTNIKMIQVAVNRYD